MPHNRWNKIQLVENFMDSPHKVLNVVGGSKAQLRHYSNCQDRHPHKRQKVESLSIHYDCSICCEEYGDEHMLHLGCQHRFCADCWKVFLTSQIKEEGQIFLTCMENGCLLPISDLFIENNVDESCHKRFLSI